MKVLSYNIHKGRSFFVRRYALADIESQLKETDADLIFLQEIHGSHPRHLADKFLEIPLEHIAEGIWPHHTYGQNATYDKGHHGNAILSKYPIIKSENIDISCTPYAKRGLLHAVIDHPNGPFHAICVHLDLFESARTQQSKLIIERINGHVGADEAIILAGDFNDWRGILTSNFVTGLNLQEAGHLKTFPSVFPTLAMDRIYFRGFSLEDKKTLNGNQWRWLSDHLPLLVKLRQG